jgi:hypothetical protein
MTHTLAAGVSGDSGLYVSAGLVAGWKPGKCNRCGLGATSSGTLLQATLGTHAAKLSVGGASLNVFGGGAVKLSLERTWRDKGSIARGNTYLGPEVQVGYMFGTLSTGALIHVAGPARRTVRWSWGLGIGF